MNNILSEILDGIYDAVIVVNREGKIVYLNNKAERILKVEKKLCKGAFIEAIVPNTRLYYVMESEIEEINEEQDFNDVKVITSRKPLFNECGKVTGAYAVFRDVTEVNELSSKINSLQEIHELFESILYNTYDAINVVDEKGICVYINPAYTKMTGVTEEETIGKPATIDLVKSESVHMKVLKTQKALEGEVVYVGSQKREVVVDCAPIFIGNKLRGSVAVAHDKTEINRLIKELKQAKKKIFDLEAKYTFEDIIGKNQKLLAAIEKAKNAAKTPASIFLNGASGTGKELFAHAIHNASNRVYGQFVRVNCSALHEDLLESELFGYEEGAFTGAKKGGRKGLFEQANGGTIFLDEVGDISLKTQAKILRVLQEKEVRRIGSNITVPINVRIISATNKILEELVEKGQFREDLYYRLNVFPIYLPSLKDRKEDIFELSLGIIKKLNDEYGRKVKGISLAARKILINYEWVGNVRELENVIGRAMINMNSSDEIIYPEHVRHINVHRENDHQSTNLLDTLQGDSLKEIIEDAEKRYIESLLKKNNGNKTKTALELKISLRNLYYKVEKYKL
ncbi:sigma-54-dependent Fis family transcriptional regulator [Clostridium sediminicola]|uniref:sigma 54-interacting transcriptional regulator n=1 Tax=Clostridium sediminicola TaxID=3114879 RepID=UPI0031F25EBC